MQQSKGLSVSLASSIIRTVLPGLFVAVMLVMYLDPIKNRADAFHGNMTFFYALMVVSLGESAVIRVLAKSMLANPITVAGQSLLMLSSLWISTLIYAVMYYLLGGAVSYVMLLGACAIPAYIQLLLVTPAFEGAEKS